MSKHIGSSFDTFLEENDMLVETSAEAFKKVLAWQIKVFLTTNNLSKKAFAQSMHTSRSQLDRLLNPHNTNITLRSLINTVHAMGKSIEIKITDSL